MAKSSLFTFNLDNATRKCVLLFLLIGTIFNILSFAVFQYKSVQFKNDITASLDKVYSDKYDNFKIEVDKCLAFVSTNSVSSVSSSVSSSSSLPVANKIDSPILPIVDNIEYDFFIADGRHIAKIGTQYFSTGSPYPHGGVITRVYPDSIILDNKYRVSRSTSRSLDIPVVSSTSSAASVLTDFSSLPK